MVGARPHGPALLVSNHVGWLDIPVLGGALDARFVSKDEIARAPLVGWLAKLNDTVFVARRDRGRAASQARALAVALRRSRPIVIFPEGTTTDGLTPAPFRSSLFAAVAPAPEGVAVHPVALSYGPARDVVAWVGDEPAWPSVRRILGRAGGIAARVEVLPALGNTDDRKALARAANDAVTQALCRLASAMP